MVHITDIRKQEAQLIGKTRPEKGGPSSPVWKVGEYAQGYDLPKERGGILVETIPCPICRKSNPFIEHDARVELHWVGGLGYIKHVCCDKVGIWWREL